MSEVNPIEAAHVAAMVALAEHGVAPHIQEQLTHGQPGRGVAPHAMRKALAAALTALSENITASMWDAGSDAMGDTGDPAAVLTAMLNQAMKEQG